MKMLALVPAVHVDVHVAAGQWEVLLNLDVESEVDKEEASGGKQDGASTREKACLHVFLRLESQVDAPWQPRNPGKALICRQASRADD
jgi:hypothetical protein